MRLPVLSVVFTCISASSAWGQSDSGMFSKLRWTPESLAASGFSASDASVLLGRVASSDDLCTAVVAAEGVVSSRLSAFAAANADWKALPTQDHLDALTAATDLLSQSRVSLAAAKDALSAGLLSGFSASKIASIGYCAGTLDRKVPTEFKVLVRTDDDWSALEDACVIESRCLRTSTDVPDDTAALLSATRADASVVSARLGIDAQSAAIAQLLSQ
jgi:hypothetical protein